jgi:hypothetical protein
MDNFITFISKAVELAKFIKDSTRFRYIINELNILYHFKVLNIAKMEYFIK